MSKRKNLNKWLVISVFLLVAMGFFGLPAQAALYSGSGTQEVPYDINTPAKMNDIGNNPGHWASYFVLTANINLSGYTGTEFNIIGNDVNEFTGVFDGNGHTISNFTYSSTGISNIGLFGYIFGPNSEIKNLGLIDPNFDAGTGDNVGSLVGYLNNATITDCNSVGGSVSGDFVVGGLVGQNYGTVSNSYATTSVSGTHNTIGGLVGKNNVTGTVSNSYAAGSVSGDHQVGGLVGINDSGTVTNCYSTGSVSGSGDVGGLIGADNTGDYTKSFWDNTVNPNVNGIGNTTDPNVIGKSIAEMQKESTFTDWDFVGETVNGTEDIWRMCVDDVNYPMLWWEFIDGDFVCPDGVNFVDFSILGLAWRSTSGEMDWNPVCDISDPNDNIINELDLAVFVENWLLGFDN